ncbi:DUF6183 family protein [Streptomyces sp. SAI-129]|uniref:DUF6183 family protein n=1 Tax=Streptomyces sp. SAI-129 TaxID=3377727 RepID=UPI003C798672
MSHHRETPGDSDSDRHLREEPQQLDELGPEAMYEAAVRLCTVGDGPHGVSVARTTVARIAETLADTRSRDCVMFAADLVGRLLPDGGMSPREGDRLLRSVAAKLVRAQRLRDIEPLFGELPDGVSGPAVELRACLLGELALIGSGGARPSLEAYADRLRELGHPLARLPGTRLDIEHRFAVRVRGLGPVKTAQQLRSRFPEAPSTHGGAVTGRGARDARDDGRTNAAARPFHAGGWAREPEARFFTLPSRLGPDDFGISFIKELSLRCLAGEGSRRGSALACVTTPDDVLNELFAASYVGGVNGQGQGSAYARLYAWESLYALMGLPTGVPLLEAVRRAADHRWLRFMAFTDWFHHDTSDLAFAVLDPTRTRGAVLAATDTDVHRDALG